MYKLIECVNDVDFIKKQKNLLKTCKWKNTEKNTEDMNIVSLKHLEKETLPIYLVLENNETISWANINMINDNFELKKLYNLIERKKKLKKINKN